MANFKQFRKKAIKKQLSDKRYQEIFEQSKADGSLIDFISKELAKELGLPSGKEEVSEDNEVIDAEIIEDVITRG